MSMIKLYVYDQTIRTKQSFLASKRYYNKAILQFTSFVEAFASLLQISTFLFKLIQILWCKSKCNTFTLLHLENVYTTYSFMYFILGKQYLFIVRGVRLSIFFTLFFTLSTLLFAGYFQSFAVGIIVYFSFFLIHTFFNNGGPSWVGIKIVIQL